MLDRKLIKPNYRVVIRLLVVLTFGLGLSMAWTPQVQAAGDVQVSVLDGDLIIRGDDRANNIILTEDIIAGRAGTTVNSQRSIFIPDGLTDDIDIVMKGGDDCVRVELTVSIPDDLKIGMGAGADIIELLQVKVPGETQINTGEGHDIVFIDGVLGISEFIPSDFTGRFKVDTFGGEDLVEINSAIFRDGVAVNLGGGNDGVCANFHSEFLRPDQASFNGGDGVDGFVDKVIGLPTAFINFEDNPDNCSFLGGRAF